MKAYRKTLSQSSTVERWGKALAFVLLMIIAGTSAVRAQDSEFEKWKKQQESEFKEYRDKFDAEFIDMLNKTWEEVGVNLGSNMYEDKKPVEIPEAPPAPTVENERPDLKLIEDDFEVEGFNLDIPPIIIEPPKKIEKPEKEKMFGELPADEIQVEYFSSQIPLSYPVRIRSAVSKGNYRSGDIDNKVIAQFWDEISKVDHTPLIEYTRQVRTELGLNDWGYVLLINNISKSVFGENQLNLVRLSNWFLLTKAGYEVKVGYDQNGVYNLFTVKNNIFNTQYYQLDGKKFYPINFHDEQQTPSSIFTYEGSHQAQVNVLDLTVTEFPKFILPESDIDREIAFNFKGTAYNFPVKLNKDLITYFEYYPLTDLPVFFTASFSNNVKSQLYTQLAPVVKSMNELDAVNFLLRLVQTSFDYKTDQDNFDREKYMVPEETLFYQYSDCDDRSILFATLVKELLNLDVVGLRYSRHLAVAVHFRSEIEGDYHMFEGKKFVVADPTYINAPAGMTMTNYKDESPKIIKF